MNTSPSAAPYRGAGATTESGLTRSSRFRYWLGIGPVLFLLGLPVVLGLAFLCRREERVPSQIVCTTARVVTAPAPPPPPRGMDDCGCRQRPSVIIGPGVTINGNVIINGNVAMNGEPAMKPRGEPQDVARDVANNLCIVRDAHDTASSNVACAATPAALERMAVRTNPLTRPTIYAVDLSPGSTAATAAAGGADASQGIELDAARALLRECVSEGDQVEASPRPTHFIPPHTVQILLVGHDDAASLAVLAAGTLLLLLALGRTRIDVKTDAVRRLVRVRERSWFGLGGESDRSLPLDEVNGVVVGTAGSGFFAGRRVEIVRPGGGLFPLTDRYSFFHTRVQTKAARRLAADVAAAKAPF